MVRGEKVEKRGQEVRGEGRGAGKKVGRDEEREKEEIRKKEKRKEMGVRQSVRAGTRQRERGKAGAERAEPGVRRDVSVAPPSPTPGVRKLPPPLSSPDPPHSTQSCFWRPLCSLKHTGWIQM